MPPPPPPLRLGSPPLFPSRHRMEVEGPAPCAFPALRHLGPVPPDGHASPHTPSKPSGPADTAAVKLQKVYRSYRTRRRLADSVVVAELWWKAIDFVHLFHSTVFFFDHSKPESVSSKWNRVGLNASKVGKGLSNDANALKLAFQHWIEAIDPRHRYGHNLHYYYDVWCKSNAGQPFFYWLDAGDGRGTDLAECPRTLLREQFVKYLGPAEREHYEIIISDGKMIHKLTGDLLDTTGGSQNDKWIFTMSTKKELYVGKKKKGTFHHSSFLAGGATLAAGRLVAENGILKTIWAYSGHYRPSDENLESFISFLCENGIDRNSVQINSLSNGEYYDQNEKGSPEEKTNGVGQDDKPPKLEIPAATVKDLHLEVGTAAGGEEESMQASAVKGGEYKRSLSGGLPSPRADVPRNAILTRIESKGKAKSHQLGHQLSSSWSTGAGPRIGCVNDYPLDLRMQALEFVSLSPRQSSHIVTLD